MKVRTCVRKLASSGVSRNSMGGSLLGRRKLFQRLDLTPRTRRHGDTLGAWLRAGTKPRSYVDQSVGADDDYGVGAGFSAPDFARAAEDLPDGCVGAGEL